MAAQNETKVLASGIFWMSTFPILSKSIFSTFLILSKYMKATRKSKNGAPRNYFCLKMISKLALQDFDVYRSNNDLKLPSSNELCQVPKSLFGCAIN